MNTLQPFARVCTRRITTLPSSSPVTSSITKTHHHHPIKSASRLLSTTTPTPSNTSAIDLPPSPQPQTSEPEPSLSSTSPFLLTGTVTRAGTMKNCIQITQNKQVFDPHLQKHYTRPARMLIHDPNPPGYLAEGDVVEFGLFSEAERHARLERKRRWDEKLAGVKRKGGKKAERSKWRGPKMVVRRVVTAFGVGVDERMERIVREGARVEEGGELLGPAGRKGRVAKQHGSAKIAG